MLQYLYKGITIDNMSQRYERTETDLTRIEVELYLCEQHNFEDWQYEEITITLVVLEDVKHLL